MTGRVVGAQAPAARQDLSRAKKLIASERPRRNAPANAPAFIAISRRSPFAQQAFRNSGDLGGDVDERNAIKGPRQVE